MLASGGVGTRLVLGDEGSTVRLWDAETGNLLKSLTEHTGAVLSVSFSLDGKMLASAGTDGSVRLWSTETGNLLKPFTGIWGMLRV